MKRSILVVAPYVPLPANFGGALRIYNLVKNLAVDNDVCLLAPGSNEHLAAAIELGEVCHVTLVPSGSTARHPASRAKRLKQLRSLAGGVSYLESASTSSRMALALQSILTTRRFDLVQHEFPESALYPVPEHIPSVFDAHNVEHDLLARVARRSQASGKQVYNMLESRKVRRLERRLWERATVCLATSERDAGLMRSLTSTPVDVVSNGVDLQYFAFQPHDLAEPGHIVFTGAMRHQPNADGAQWYAEHVHARLLKTLADASFSIVGADPPPSVEALQSSSITVTGQVDDIRPYLARASVVAVPLWSGGGTRLKILEAFASGRPVVSTSTGAEGLDVRDGEHLLIADTVADFERAIIRISEDAVLAQHLAESGRSLVEQGYGWDSIIQRLVTAHDKAIELSRN